MKKTRILFSIALGALISGCSASTTQVNGALVPGDARLVRDEGVAVLVSERSLGDVERFYRRVYTSDPHVRIGRSSDELVIRTTNFEEPWSMIAVEKVRAGVRIYVVPDDTLLPVLEADPAGDVF